MPPTKQLRSELLDLAHSWRTVLADDPANARPVISALLLGRVTNTPLQDGRWKQTGDATLSGLFTRVFSVALASPDGLEYFHTFRGSALKKAA